MSDWNGFELDEFLFHEHKAIVVKPSTSSNGRWLYKTEYFGAFPEFEIAMLNKGYHVCYVATKTRWANDEDLEIMYNFVEYVSKEYNLSKKCIPVGMSCGGLKAVKFAERHPDKIAVMYIDAPVLNILSMAIGTTKFDRWQELVNAYGFSKSTILNFRESPIDKMEVLIDNDIPIIMVYGDADDIVCYTENGKVLEDYYKKHNGTIKIVSKSMCGHHPHGLEDTRIIEKFIEENYKE
jgi:alpha-beta hydrolase superfamily lysophospholipase